MTILEFLAARLDEDQILAELQAPWPWHVGDEPTEVFAADNIEVATAFALSTNQQRNTAAFIARHDPAHVLREVQAKRTIVEFYETARTALEASDGTILAGAAKLNLRAYGNALRVLAASYAEHSDYDPTWDLASG